MPKENAPELFGLFYYFHQLSNEAKRGMKASLEECPKCHFVMLEGVLANIEQHGTDGSIYVSDLAAAVRQPMPAVSRWLRQLEQDGLIERITDPNDRRKTLGHVTEKGLASSRQCELALSGYFDRGGAPPDAPAADPAAGAEGCSAGCGDGRKCGIPDQIEGRQSKWVRSSSSWPATGPPAWS